VLTLHSALKITNHSSLWWLDNLQEGVQYCGAKSIISKIDGFELRACHA